MRWIYWISTGNRNSGIIKIYFRLKVLYLKFGDQSFFLINEGKIILPVSTWKIFYIKSNSNKKRNWRNKIRNFKLNPRKPRTYCATYNYLKLRCVFNLNKFRFNLSIIFYFWKSIFINLHNIWYRSILFLSLPQLNKKTMF